jgi:hypothetical protein
MATRYPVELAVTLRPINTTQPIRVAIAVDDDQRLLTIDQTTTVNFSYTAEVQGQLTVEIVDQQAQEGVEIITVAFFDIADDKFAWAGIYEPEYPEPWATEQKSQGTVLAPQLTPHTYLSWPGKWTLNFTVPVFMWMHKVQNLGWIYD